MILFSFQVLFLWWTNLQTCKWNTHTQTKVGFILLEDKQNLHWLRCVNRLLITCSGLTGLLRWNEVTTLWSVLVQEEVMVASPAGVTEYVLERVSPQAWSSLLRGDGPERVWLGHDHPAPSWAVRWSGWSVISSKQVSSRHTLPRDGPPDVSVLPDTTPAGGLKLGLVPPSADMDERIIAPSHQNSSCTFCQCGLASLPTHTDFKARIFWAADPRKSKREYKLLQTHRGTVITRAWLGTHHMGPVLDWKWKTQNGLSRFCLMNERLVLLQDAGSSSMSLNCLSCANFFSREVKVAPCCWGWLQRSKWKISWNFRCCQIKVTFMTLIMWDVLRHVAIETSSQRPPWGYLQFRSGDPEEPIRTTWRTSQT